MGRLVVVVPLREGEYKDALALLREGPPPEAERGGLERYQAFLSSREAILVLEGPGVGGSDGPLWEGTRHLGEVAAPRPIPSATRGERLLLGAIP